MRELTDAGREAVAVIARRRGVSPEAALTLLRAVADGGGRRAQFSHPELGGSGQWMAGGMLMVGDMFNDALKAKVAGLCADLSALFADGAPFGTSPAGGGGAGDWWPAGLGAPSAAGDQNGRRYALFASARRLVIEDGGHVTLYDTGDYRIGGVAQQQGGGASLSFTSQRGLVDVSRLPVVPLPKEDPAPTPPAAPSAGGDVISLLERLADLKQKGVLTEDEFVAKKVELLGRL